MSNELREAAEKLLAACDELAKYSKDGYVISVISEYIKASNMVKATRETLRKALSTPSPEGEADSDVLVRLNSAITEHVMIKEHIAKGYPFPNREYAASAYKCDPIFKLKVKKSVAEIMTIVSPFITRPAPQARLSDDEIWESAEKYITHSEQIPSEELREFADDLIAKILGGEG